MYFSSSLVGSLTFYLNEWARTIREWYQSCLSNYLTANCVCGFIFSKKHRKRKCWVDFLFLYLVCGKSSPHLQKIYNSCLATLWAIIGVVHTRICIGLLASSVNTPPKSSLLTNTVHLSGTAYTWPHSQHPTSPLLCGKWIRVTAAVVFQQQKTKF